MSPQFSPKAIEDIYEIVAYLEADSYEAAARIAGQIFEACDRIAETPYLGHWRTEFLKPKGACARHYAGQRVSRGV